MSVPSSVTIPLPTLVLSLAANSNCIGGLKNVSLDSRTIALPSVNPGVVFSRTT